MRLRMHRGRKDRSGAAALELALLLPVLTYMAAVSTDYPRLFYALATLSDSARAGALYYATHPTASASTIQQVAQADAGDLSPLPTVESTSGTDASGNAYVQVTVSWTFQTLTVNPGIPSSTVLSRTVVMMVNPS